MTIKYYGQLRDCHQNTRVAEIGFDEQNAKDVELADRLIGLMEKVTPWEIAGGFDDCYLVSIEDKNDYDDFKEWYKEAKKMLIQCMKYGF